jgi:hypothetical protein
MDHLNRHQRPHYRQHNHVVHDSSTTSTEGKQGSECNGEDPPEASQHNRPVDEQRTLRELAQRERARRNAARLRRRRKERIDELIRRLKEYSDRKVQLDGEISQLRREVDQIQQENAYAREQLLLPVSSTNLRQSRPEVDSLSSALDFCATGSSTTAGAVGLSSTQNVASEQIVDLLRQYIEIERLLDVARSLQTARGQSTASQIRATVGTGFSLSSAGSSGGEITSTVAPNSWLLPPAATVTATDVFASRGDNIPSDSTPSVGSLQ